MLFKNSSLKRDLTTKFVLFFFCFVFYFIFLFLFFVCDFIKRSNNNGFGKHAKLSLSVSNTSIFLDFFLPCVMSWFKIAFYYESY